MNRRVFIKAGGAALLALQAGAVAQQRSKLPRVGMLLEPYSSNDFLAAFREGLHELGHVIGQDFLLDYRTSDGSPRRLAFLAAQLVRLKVAVLLAGGSAAASAAMRSTHRIPVVFADADDALVEGLVTDVEHPAGNLTGLSTFESRVNPKRLELLAELMPHARRIAVLVDPKAAPGLVAPMQRVAERLRLALQMIAAGNAEEVRQALEVAKRSNAQAIFVSPSPTFAAFGSSLVDLAARGGWAGVFPHRQFAEGGAIMSYGPQVPDMYRRAARYVLSLLQGAAVAKLPVEQARLELVINLKSARMQRLHVPPKLAARADYVIQ